MLYLIDPKDIVLGPKPCPLYVTCPTYCAGKCIDVVYPLYGTPGDEI